MSLIGRTIDRAHERRDSVDKAKQDFLTWSGVYSHERAGLNTTGIPVDTITALKHSAFWACVNLIADSVAGLPWGTFESQKESRVPYPEPPVMAKPNPELTPFELRHQGTVALVASGNFYARKLFDRRGRLGELWPYKIGTVHPYRAKNAAGPAVRFRVNGGDELTPDDILHIRAFTLPGELEGLSPVAMMEQTIATGLAAGQYGGSYFGNAATPSVVITAQPGTSRPEAEEMVDAFIEGNAGLGRQHKPIVLAGAEIKQLQADPEKAMLIEVQRFIVNEVCRWCRVPPHMVMDIDRSTSWGSGIDQQTLGFLKFTLLAWLVRWEQAINPLLGNPAAFVRWNLDGFLRADLKTRYEAYKIGREGRWLSANDVLRKEDEPPIEGGDYYSNPSLTPPARKLGGSE